MCPMISRLRAFLRKLEHRCRRMDEQDPWNTIGLHGFAQPGTGGSLALPGAGTSVYRDAVAGVSWRHVGERPWE